MQKYLTPEFSGHHAAIADIRYSACDGSEDGILIYLKPSLSGDEPADVHHYAAENHGFPHQATADQFFNESQFESYRRLGLHVVERIRASAPQPRPMDLADFVEAATAYCGGAPAAIHARIFSVSLAVGSSTASSFASLSGGICPFTMRW